MSFKTEYKYNNCQCQQQISNALITTNAINTIYKTLVLEYLNSSLTNMSRDFQDKSHFGDITGQSIILKLTNLQFNWIGIC